LRTGLALKRRASVASSQDIATPMMRLSTKIGMPEAPSQYALAKASSSTPISKRSLLPAAE
jgi:hypothetical protein